MGEVGRRRILVVEDHPLNRELVAVLLEHSGFDVRLAGTAEEGIDLARDTRPDLILMDIQLPGMDGLSAIAHLRESVDTAHIPVVVVSAHALPAHRREALASGAVGYLSKPVDTRTFVREVERYLPRRGRARARVEER